MTAAQRTDRPWRAAVVAVAGLLVVIAVVGVAGIVTNRAIHQRVEDAVAFDVELQDVSDDLLVHVLEVRHYHRDLLLNNPDPTRIELWQARYADLIDEIGELERLLAQRPTDVNLPDLGELRRAAEDYHASFRRAVQEDVGSREEFRDVAEDLLVPLEGIQNRIEAFEAAGDERASAAFADIDEASTTGTVVLATVMLGLGAIGLVLGYAILRLIQDQRRLVAVEQAAAAQLAEASRAKTDFIADASHELRTPLTVLRGNAEIGLAMDDTCGHREILGEIVSESVRMSRIVDDLLFLARSDASGVPLELREADAAQLMGSVAARAEILAHERGGELRSDLDCSGTIQVDAERVAQAVMVLVDNAAKYGGTDDPVELEARTTDGRLEIAVLDRGPGIAPEERTRIFERFYRADGDARRRAGGAGLGLPIAAAIVEGHGGRIGAEERDGGGTRMWMSLPVAAAA
ncbi:MAG TPA: ATP-binding protein [Candidatus Limnocylindria bacterium]|nr:ATP-binding protein [Candidatus Limnocylindria bacterium]